MANQKKRIIELEELTTLTDNDYVATDNSASGGETKKFKLKRLSDSITELAEDMEEAIDGVIEETDSKFEEALALGTTSGSIATFTDGSTLPMRKLEVAIEPQQDLHGYENPWVGGSGKNKYEGSPSFDGYTNLSTWVKDTSTYNGHEVYKKSELWNGLYKFIYLPVGTYTFSVSAKADNAMQATLYLSGKDGTATTDPLYTRVNLTNSWQRFSGTFTVSTSGTIALRLEKSSNVDGYVYVSEYQVEQGSTATTYAPYSNICPISGWDECKVTRCKKNLFSYDNGFYNVYYTSNAPTGDGSFITLQNASGWKSAKIKVKGLSKITISGFMSQGGVNGAWLGSNDFNDVISTFQSAYNNGTKQVPDGAEYIVLGVYNINTNYSTYPNAQIEKGDTSTAYEPYNGQTYTIDLDGTRYGGTLDVVSGLLTVDRAEVDLGTLNWTAQTDSQGTYFRSSKPNGMKAVQSGVIPNALCSIYPTTTSSNVYDGSIAFSVGSEGYTFVRDTRFADATAFKQAMNGVQLVYELATPQTIQLTPTEVKSLLATNNVFADTGEVLDATYVRNANITINDLIRRIENLENA